MRPIKINPVRGIPIGARIVVADNSGARSLQVISVKVTNLELENLHLQL